MKKVLISIFTLIFVISMATVVNAASTGTITLTSSSTTVKAGDEFSVIVSAQDTNGYNGIQYKDITITNESGVTTSSIEFKEVTALENNSKFNGVGDEAGVTAFTYSLTDNNTSSVQVCKLTFKVNDGITAGTYNINIGNMKVFSLNETDNTTEIGTKTVSVKAIVDKTTIGDKDDSQGTETPSKTPSSTPKKTSSGDSGSTSTNGGSSSKKTKLPQTGVETASIIAIVGLSVFAVISYVAYKKYKNI